MSNAYVVVLGEYSDATPMAAFTRLEDAQRWARRQRAEDTSHQWRSAIAIEVVPLDPAYTDAAISDEEERIYWMDDEGWSTPPDWDRPLTGA